jgi:uncharacterized cupredoxin-like copper-binding protein
MREGGGTMTCIPERIEVRKGEQIKLVIKNAGQLRHELLIATFGGNAKHRAEMEKSPDMAHEEPNGRHACLMPGNYESGMKGIVVVK